MNDPYKKIFEDIVKAINKSNEMIVWISKRTLSAKDYIEFVNEFTEKKEDQDEPTFEDWIKGEGR